MVYREKFVAVVKVNGKILREKNGRVFLPFGSEYSLLLKNLNSQKASVKVSIDGKDVLNNNTLMLAPNSELDLERYVESLDKGNRFKFIQKTNEIIEHRGDRVDDGIVRVEFAFEQINKTIHITERYDHQHDYFPHYPTYPWYTSPWITWITTNSNKYTPLSTKGVSTNTSQYSVMSCCSTIQPQEPLPDEGITVRGSQSNQSFQNAHIGLLDPAEVIILHLSGYQAKDKKVEAPITVRDRIKCETCGASLPLTVNFCEKCGTAIKIR